MNVLLEEKPTYATSPKSPGLTQLIRQYGCSNKYTAHTRDFDRRFNKFKVHRSTICRLVSERRVLQPKN